jgi:capsular exopolysaccharide synthesis family protein
LNQNSEIISRKDVINVVATVLSNWYIIVAFPFIAFLVSYIYTHRIPDVYAAKCQVLLKSNETYDYQQQIYKGLGFNSKYASYEETASQMRVLSSSSLIDLVLHSIPLDVSYYIVGRLKVTEVYKHLPFKVVTNDKTPSFSGVDFNLSIIDTSKFVLIYEVNGVTTSKDYKFGELILDNGLYLKVIKEPNLNRLSIGSLSKIDYLFLIYKRNQLINKYQSAIETENVPYTSIVEIKLQDEISSRAVEVLDTLATIFVENTLSNKKEVNRNTLSYIDAQLDEVIGIINNIESELEKYKEQKAILNLTKEEDTYFAQLIQFDTKKRGFDTQLRALDDLTDYLLLDEDVKTLLPPNLFVSNTDPALSKKVEELYGLREEFTDYLNSSTENNPRVSLIEESIGSLKEDIIRYIESQKVAIQKELKLTVVDISKLEAKIKNIPKTQRQILNIERRLTVNEDLYSFLLSKRAETVIARAGIVPETKIIERSRNIGVVYPNKTRMNLLATMVGLAFAVLIILAKEVFFKKITSIRQLQNVTTLSVLGSIPKLTGQENATRVIGAEDRSHFAQAFRMLRTNLQYFVKKEGPQTILVTSLLPGEGKTFTSVNLASVLAMANNKVLIMDFDLHKPRLYKALNLPNEKGMSNVLIGNMRIEDVLQPSEFSNVDAITSGPIPPNASEIIHRKEIETVFDFAFNNYDYVILDTPPVSLISDGISLMDRVDIKLFVINSKSATKTSIDYIDQLIEKNKVEDCALILNEEKRTRLDYYYSRYGYGGYGYYDSYSAPYGGNTGS